VRGEPGPRRRMTSGARQDGFGARGKAGPRRKMASGARGKAGPRRKMACGAREDGSGAVPAPSALGQRLLDGRLDLGARRLDLGLEAGEDLAAFADQELVEVPFDLTRKLGVGRGAGQVVEEGID